MDLSFLQDKKQRELFIRDQSKNLNKLFYGLPQQTQYLTLKEFNELFIYKFDKEAELKKWKPTNFQAELEKIWEENPKSCILAPREHLKTSSVLQYIVKKVYSRTYPLEINYYHLNSEMASEKFGKLLMIIENNPLLSANFRPKIAKSWSRKSIQLYDGTLIKPFSYQQGTLGKHPHLIVMDDIIDSSVIYSDLQNRKAINKFYTEIYPMISKMEQGKQILIIGTAQRKDDLYHSLPEDFILKVYQAILNEEKREVLCPEIFSYEALMKLKADISFKHGEKFWLKEYMNLPFEAMGLILKPEWIKEYYQQPQNLFIYQGWDLAVGKFLDKGDYTVCVTLGIEEGPPIGIYILDVFRERLDFGARLQKIQDLYYQWKPLLVGVEETAFQYDLVLTLQKTTALPIKGVKSIINKVQSFQAELGPYFERGQVYIRPKMQDLKNELLSLPVGQYDDQADALKIAIKTANIYPMGGHFKDIQLKSNIKPITAGIWNKQF